MVFSTNSDLFYTYLQYKSIKSHGFFGLGWKNQEHTVKGINMDCKNIDADCKGVDMDKKLPPS